MDAIQIERILNKRLACPVCHNEWAQRDIMNAHGNEKGVFCPQCLAIAVKAYGVPILREA